ncbi:hypothetical protein VOLCADRAFT_99432 [Volvox carteri f. nagariensis]|uniref:Apple domain-containing protein n=1 Tax=Volvox carteri f. nagariensis TaxID=3068 RepID=D8UHS7_VOLCA|nr:uncharacterized protein VOLCADRAFT_99432 [Volvox carteri f. nagariensis]EFJ40737.1 hypothetical protein VOLCADRAFT_99432 [Volvox carteri f. nagariensis]|eukprot:XP_002958203.1 hypothetical protein VOLCADRAFT_99432 [Volvox carteri f. nagariensis]
MEQNYVGLFAISRIVLYNRRDCCGEQLVNAEIRVGGALVSNSLTAAQINLNQLVRRVAGASTSGAIITVELRPPVTGRYITLQNFGNNATARAASLQVAELQQHGAGYGNSALVLATSTQPDAGACCQACFSRVDCIHWDYTPSSHTCHLRPDSGPRLDIQMDGDRVTGSRNEVRWISSLPTAFVPFGQRVIASAWQSTTFYRTFWLSAEQLQQQQAALGGVVTTPVLNLTIIADDLATAFVNGQEVGRTAVFPERSVLQVSNLRPGPNLVVLHCNSTGGLPVVAASLAFGGPDGSVLLQTDHTWNWL